MLTCTPAHCYSSFIAFLLLTFSPPFWVVLFIVVLVFALSNSPSHLSVILSLFFSTPSHSVSQSPHSFIKTALSRHVNITVPHSNSTTHTPHSPSCSFFPTLCWPALSHPFIFPLGSRLAPTGGSKEARMQCRFACK